jgi:hypothetical protein
VKKMALMTPEQFEVSLKELNPRVSPMSASIPRIQRRRIRQTLNIKEKKKDG